MFRASGVEVGVKGGPRARVKGLDKAAKDCYAIKMHLLMFWGCLQGGGGFEIESRGEVDDVGKGRVRLKRLAMQTV